MERSCLNCKFWERVTTRAGRDLIGKCNCPKMVYVGDDGIDKIDDDGLGYADAEDYSAYLYVGGLFGCIHFTEK